MYVNGFALQRCQSVPLLKGCGESLKEELSLSSEKVSEDATYNIADLLTGTKNARKPVSGTYLSHSSHPNKLAREYSVVFIQAKLN